MKHKTETRTSCVAELTQLLRQIDALKKANAQLNRETESLRESRAKYEAIVEAFDGFLYICSSDYEVEFMNERLIERTGRNAVGGKCYQVLHELEHVCPWCVNERVFRGETVRWEVKSPKDNRWYSIVNSPLRHQDGSLSKMAMIQDITERKLSEEIARKQNEFVNHVLESLTHPFYVIDAHDYGLLMANSAAQWDPSSEKTTCYALTHGQNEPCNTSSHPCPIEEVKKTGKPVTVEHVHYDKDGVARNVEVHAYPIFDAEGDVAQILEYCLDITDRKRIEAERERLIRRLQTKNEDLKMFGSAVSHDLRSPLITMSGLLQWIERDAVSGNTDRLKANIGLISSAAVKMEHLLDELRQLSLVGRLEASPEAFSLEQIAREAVELLAGRIQDSRAEIEITSCFPKVRGDRGRLVQVFQNLIENAIKFGKVHEPPRIEIGVRLHRDETFFYVRDNGIGIDPSDHEKIFGLFSRLDDHTEGTGFGLALVKRIIEAHQGRVWVESLGNGHGSTFCFTLPGMAVNQDADS